MRAMKNRKPLVALALAAAFIAAGSYGVAAQTPSALVADLYRQHDAKRSPFFQTKSRARVDKYFTKGLADLIWKDAKSANGEVGAFDGDPLYNAQDMEISHFAVGSAVIRGKAAIVRVTFSNLGKREAIDYWLMKVKGAWKIDNISYGKGETLRKWLTAG